eukprot:CAMPEP_0194503330 /NCGR_PEP_ID=MMETSP0253-20130528/28317_1 /TAXON_ID=2966 /ORGANISM="Noctiluca scintillans" /LENGTH=685 /DNA_ID=CAMNT_0039345607 /DNA_START=38 /DNA_END=2095 /DNA_ORIENTATION=-
MATDLEGFERAYRLRSTADDGLLRQVFDVDDLDALRESSPATVDTARLYFPHLTSSTYERLAREPDNLANENERCKREMERLAVTNYSAFIGNSQVIEAVQCEFADIQDRLDSMAEMLVPVQEQIQEFQTKSSNLSLRRAALRGVLQQSSTLLELLELPQLLDACIRNQMYDESLELLSFCGSLLQAHELRAEEIPVLTMLGEDVAVQRANLLGALLGQLRTDIHLPACVRVIGHLRRLQDHSEEALRQSFIEQRGAFLEGHKQQVESLRSSRSSVINALRNAADLLRTHVFDIGMQYRTLFKNEEGPLCVWINEQVAWFTELLRVHVLPSDGQGAERQGVVQGLRRPVTEARIDAAELARVLRQCWHASTTLKRLGAHFFPSVTGIFETRMRHHVFEMLDVSLLTFHSELGRYDWVASTAFAAASQTASATMSTTEGEDSGDRATLHPEALELMRHRPLAVFSNDLVQTFNEFRQCAIFGLRTAIVRRCHETLLGAVNLLRSVRLELGALWTREAKSSKAVEFQRACTHFGRILVPLAAAHLDALFGQTARFDVSGIVAAMTPDLLATETPVDPSSWDMQEPAPAEKAEHATASTAGAQEFGITAGALANTLDNADAQQSGVFEEGSVDGLATGAFGECLAEEPEVHVLQELEDDQKRPDVVETSGIDDAASLLVAEAPVQFTA